MIVVIPALNRQDVLSQSLGFLLEATSEATHIFVWDNGSDPPLVGPASARLHIERVAENIGNYPIFAHGLALAERLEQEHVAFLHSDFLMYEHHWDRQVLDQFDLFLDLGLIGCVGSSEIDANGGRGLGTVSNFLGAHGAHGAEIHGKRSTGLTPAAVVDGCAMIFRTDVLRTIGTRPDFPPHHLYDRLLSCQVLEAGHRIAVLGLRGDHLGMRTATGHLYQDFCREWAERHALVPALDTVGNPNWDLTIYLAGESLFLKEYRDEKHLIPCYVDADWVRHDGAPPR